MFNRGIQIGVSLVILNGVIVHRVRKNGQRSGLTKFLRWPIPPIRRYGIYIECGLAAIVSITWNPPFSLLVEFGNLLIQCFPFPGTKNGICPGLEQYLNQNPCQFSWSCSPCLLLVCGHDLHSEIVCPLL
jgi:hypothetical protein